MVNVPYHVAKVQGELMRSLYKLGLPQIVKIPIPQTQSIPVIVYALSCERDLPEQVASIRSFIHYAGIPKQFIVISDGSYTKNSCDLLRRIHPCVEVLHLEKFVRTDLPKHVYDYAAQHPMGKKLSLLLSIPVKTTTIYADSDILFFPGAIDLVDLVNLNDKFPRYLPDCTINMDERVIYDKSEQLNPVNGGFLIFKKKLDWSFALERLLKLKELTNYFTEQTLVHLTIHHNHGVSLCSKRYVLNVEDQFIYPDQYSKKEIALRHYVRDIRHKFWFNAGLL